MKIKIEKCVPIPSRNSAYDISAQLKELKVGDSFEVECTHNRRVSIANAARNNKIILATRATEKGFRFWRIK